MPRFRTSGLDAERLTDNEKKKRLYGLFYDICVDKQAVCQHYLQYSPDAFFPWLLENLHLYQFNTPQAKELHQSMKANSIRADMAMNVIQNNCDNLRAYLDSFLKMFQDDYPLACLGVKKEESNSKDAITATNSDAFFVYDESLL